MHGTPPVGRWAPRLAEARRLASLAWPVMLTSLNWTAMHLIDVAVVGHAGTAELGALAASRAILYVLLVSGLAGLSGVLVFVARSDGAGRPEDSGATLHAGLIAGLLAGTVAAALLLLAAEPMIRAIGVAPALAAPGAHVARMLAIGMPAQLAGAAASYFLEGASRPVRVTIVNLSLLPLNALLAWMLALGHFGAPAWGAAGAALATSGVAWIGAAALLMACWTLPDAGGRGLRDLSPAARARAAQRLPAILRFGVMPGFAAGLELAGFSALIALSTRLGDVTAAAFQAVFSLHNVGFSLGLGMGSAAGVRVGNAVGAGEPQAALSRALIAAAMAWTLMTLLAALYLCTAPATIAIFTDDPAVRMTGVSLLLGFAWFLPFDGVQAVCMSALRSLGDQVAAGVNGILAYFLVTGGLGWWLVERGGGARALVIAAGAGMVAAALLQGARLAAVTRRTRA
jgi:MATE family multidrug resistance protein